MPNWTQMLQDIVNAAPALNAAGILAAIGGVGLGILGLFGASA